MIRKQREQGLKIRRTLASNSKGRRLSSLALAVCHTWILLKTLSVSHLYTMNEYTNAEMKKYAGEGLWSNCM